MVISISYTPGLLILPQAEINFVPVDFPTPIFAYSSPPSLMIGTTAAMFLHYLPQSGSPINLLQQGMEV